MKVTTTTCHFISTVCPMQSSVFLTQSLSIWHTLLNLSERQYRRKMPLVIHIILHLNLTETKIPNIGNCRHHFFHYFFLAFFMRKDS